MAGWSRGEGMSHRKFEHPRHGSLGFLPRKRASRHRGKGDLELFELSKGAFVVSGFHDREESCSNFLHGRPTFHSLGATFIHWKGKRVDWFSLMERNLISYKGKRGVPLDRWKTVDCKILLFKKCTNDHILLLLNFDVPLIYIICSNFLMAVL